MESGADLFHDEVLVAELSFRNHHGALASLRLCVARIEASELPTRAR
jgi:hypothetical protein